MFERNGEIDFFKKMVNLPFIVKSKIVPEMNGNAAPRLPKIVKHLNMDLIVNKLWNFAAKTLCVVSKKGLPGILVRHSGSVAERAASLRGN